MQVSIRAVTREDEQRWRSLWEGYNVFYKRTVSEEVTANTFSRFLDDKVQLYCAVAVAETPDAASAQVIGFVTWFPHFSTAAVEPVVYLNDLFVDPDQRLHGVGGKLIEHVYKHSKEVIGAQSVYWHTQHFNHRAQLLYVKKGNKTDFVQYEKSF
ncbi:hypothetical protein NQ176_g4608 [Zarea fungicola]|uniref:Uncharacterized protein n=1 Tax=Zarea fungicola TaxID=93591 RepID=A0ACC1NDZ1_9HYPO|nr:hypothetical protein NQ176_g4608 [Lecanicillium fungicola]